MTTNANPQPTSTQPSASDGYEPYVVRAGDHLAALVAGRGADAVTVWNHPSNASLREKRASYAVLHAGDIIHLPPQQRSSGGRGIAFKKGETNKLSAIVSTQKLRVVFSDDAGPLANEACEIDGLPSSPVKAKTDQDGRLEFEAPIDCRSVTVRFPKHDRSYTLLLGDVDPTKEPLGPVKRLQNLGFLIPGSSPTSPALQNAVKAFQKSQGLPVTGELDEATLNALSTASGQPD